jgi:hypothetical protein
MARSEHHARSKSRGRLEGGADEIDPLDASLSVSVNRVSGEMGSTRGRIAVVSRDEVTMQVGLLVSQDQVVHLDRAESLLNGFSCSQDVGEEDATLRLRQVVGLSDMARVDNDAVSRGELVGAQPEHTAGKARDRSAVGVDVILGHAGLHVFAQRASISPHESLPLVGRYPARRHAAD